MSSDEIKTIEEANTRIEILEGKVRELERIIKNRTYLPNTSLIDNSFIKRAFAVLGHYLIASLIIAIPFYIVFFIIALSVGLFNH